jgi:ribosomal protein S6--L-glutamate ligase
MRIVILGSNQELYSHRRLQEAGEARGHEVRFVNIKHCYMNISASNPQIYYRGGELLQNIDAVIPRIRPSMTFYGTAVVRQFEMMGIYCLNESVAIARSRDKLRTLQLLSRKGVDMPITGFADSPEDTKNLIKLVGGAPLVVKLLEGTQGMGVVLAHTNVAAESVINAFKTLKANILVQEFIEEAGGRDIRCFVVGNKVVAAMQRQAQAGEFRANLHMGGSASGIDITDQEKQMAVKAAKIVGLRVAGVDIVRSKEGPKILEINSSPGLEGIEDVTKQDIAVQIIRYIERHTGPNRNRMKGQG